VLSIGNLYEPLSEANVTVESGGLPQEGASIELTNEGITRLTDLNGVAPFYNLPNGSHRFLVIAAPLPSPRVKSPG